MKKLTAMLLSLVMCFSLLAIPAQASSDPDPDDPTIIDVGGDPTDPGEPGNGDPAYPGDDDPDEPGNSLQAIVHWPEPREVLPVD